MGFGARLHLVHPFGFELNASRIRRSGLDYWENVDLCEHESTDAFFEHATEAYDLLIGFSAPHRFGSVSLADYCMDTKRKHRVCLVFGNETHGMEFLRDEQRALMDMVYIPASPAIRSLNLATCVSIGAWEAIRQAGVTHQDLAARACTRAPVGRWDDTGPESQR